LSLHKKIFISFLFIALLPFFTLLYLLYDKNTSMALERFETIHIKSLEQTVLLIQEDIKELQRELQFLSSLALMDDLVSDDVDKRILELIRSKQSIFKFQTHIHVRSEKGRCIASTNGCQENSLGLKFKQPIFLSFQDAKRIGEIEIDLPYKSLNHYFAEYSKAWCLKKGEDILLNAGNKIEGLEISRILIDDLSISLYLNKDEMEVPLVRLKNQLISIFIFSFVSFLALFFFVSRAISKPILENEKLVLQKLELQENELLLLEEAKRSAQIKARFISQISHDFRTPLNSIIGFSQFLDQEHLVQDEYKKLPKNIEKAGKHLLDMVNQILDFSKAENEYLPLEVQDFSLSSLMSEVIEIMMPLAQKKELQLRYMGKDIVLKTDKSILKNILINLIANAIKFTEQGDVQVSLEVKEKGFLIKVRDSGVGIQEEDEKELFKPFTRFENSKLKEGSGLGLALCAAYAQRLGMNLSYKALVSGSEFSIIIKKEDNANINS